MYRFEQQCSIFFWVNRGTSNSRPVFIAHSYPISNGCLNLIGWQQTVFIYGHKTFATSACHTVVYPKHLLMYQVLQRLVFIFTLISQLFKREVVSQFVSCWPTDLKVVGFKSQHHEAATPGHLSKALYKWDKDTSLYKDVYYM